MKLKSPKRRERREKNWIYIELDKFIVLFIKQIKDYYEKWSLSSIGILEFEKHMHNIYNELYIYDEKWIIYVNGLKLDPKKHVIPYNDLFINRAKFIIAQFYLIDICKIPTQRVKYYLKDGYLKEDLETTLTTILCEELVRKNYLPYPYTKKRKKNYSWRTLKKVILDVFSLIKGLLSHKKKNI